MIADIKVNYSKPHKFFRLWIVRRKWDNMPGLIAMMLLILVFFFVEYYVTMKTESVAIRTDAYHMLSEFGALLIGLITRHLSTSESRQNTFGWARVEILGVCINGIFLMGLCFNLTVTSIQKLLSDGYNTEGWKYRYWVLQIASVGFFIKLLSFFLFYEKGAISVKLTDAMTACGESTPLLGNHKDYRENELLKSKLRKSERGHFKLQSVILHIIGGFVASIGAVVAGFLYTYIDDPSAIGIADPLISIAMVIVMVGAEVFLIRDAALILLQTVPSHIRPEALEQKLLKSVKGILAIHEFHVWQLCGAKIVCSLHITCTDSVEYMRIAEDVKEFFHNEGIHSTTVQPEFLHKKTPESLACVLECGGPEKNCKTDTCCSITEPKVRQRSRNSEYAENEENLVLLNDIKNV